MAMLAVAFPILPGKTDAWRAFMAELDGPRNAEFVASRANAGVRERTFLQHTPMGDLVIVTIEADDPGRAFGQVTGANDAFSTWFREQVQSIHGIDLTQPMTSPPSELLIDSGPVAVLAG